MFSIVVLTLNEERDLPRCLASILGCDDIVVLDSGSTDRTANIARAAGAQVFTREFDDFAGQRNHAQREIPFKHPWVFHLDADEQMTPSLFDECIRISSNAEADIDGFWVAPKMIFEGKWIPHCTDFPAYQARFVRAPRFEFIQVGHGQREAPHMRMKHLRENYLHDLSSDGTGAWLEKHQRYAVAEAAQLRVSGPPARWRDLTHSDALIRRRTLKHLSHGLPYRPSLRFVYQYILRRGFLDGRAGYKYCRLLMRYEAFIAQALRNPPRQQG